MKVLVIIPSYKKPEQLEKCLKHIDSQVFTEEIYTSVIDTFIHDNNEDNIGFTKAINLGLIQAIDKRYDYALVLNQDCYLMEDGVQNYIEFMKNNPNCAVSAAMQISDQDSDQIIFGGCGGAFPYGQHIVGKLSEGHCSESKKMPWVNGANMFIDVRKLPRIGLFDENMILIGSDSDFCYRARAAKFDVWYCATSKCIHEGGVSTKTSSKELEIRKSLDMKYFETKWITDDLFRELALEIFR